MKNTKRFMAAVMTAAMVSALAPMAVFAESKNTEVTLIKAPTTDELYIVTIPSSLTVEDSGWNALGTGIKVEKAPIAGTNNEFLAFEPTKKVAITASSANSWKLVADGVTQNVGYTLKSTSADTSAVTNWDFMADEITPVGTTKTAGIDVDATDYAAAPAGTYTDKITFTISVEDAVITKTLTLEGEYFDYDAEEDIQKSLTIEYTDDDTWNDIAARYDDIIVVDNFLGPEGKVIKFFGDEYGCELKCSESNYQYELVSINDKVSAYTSTSYYLGY